MTTPRVQGGGEANVSPEDASASIDTEGQAAEATQEEATQNPNKEKKMNLRFGLGYGKGFAGNRDSYLFPGKHTGWDYDNAFLNGGLNWDVGVWGDNGETRLRLGFDLEYMRTQGNENTLGSNSNVISAFFRPEFDWRGAWGSDTIAGPSRIYFPVGPGLSWGTNNFGTGSLHDQGPDFALNLMAALNLVNVAHNGLEVGADIFFRTNVADGRHNFAQNILGVILDFHGAREPYVPPPPPPVDCANEKQYLDEDRARIAELLAEINGTESVIDPADGAIIVLGKPGLKGQLEDLKFYLTNLKENPFDQANTVKALRLGHIVDVFKSDLSGDGVDNDALQKAVLKASKAEPAEWAAIFGEVEGIDPAKLQQTIDSSQRIYGDGYDFWAIPGGNTNLDEAKIAALLAKECRTPEDEIALEELLRELDKAKIALERQHQAYNDKIERAVHLAGLTIGQEDTKEILAATIINVTSPSFKSDYPKPPEKAHGKDMDKIKELAKGGFKGVGSLEIELDDKGAVKKVSGLPKELSDWAKRNFSAPDHEIANLYRLAKWLNGEGKLPGEERIKKVLQEKFEGRVEEPSEAAQKEFEEFIKGLSLGIFGHTDSDGKNEYNQALSERRAEAVAAWLEGFGVDPKRIETQGFGEDFPAKVEGVGDRDERLISKGLNRRVEYVPVQLTAPITASAASLQGHVDGADVPVEDGGTKGKGKKDKAESKDRPASRPQETKPAEKPAAKKDDADFEFD